MFESITVEVISGEPQLALSQFQVPTWTLALLVSRNGGKNLINIVHK